MNPTGAGTVPLSVILPTRHSQSSLVGVLDALVPQVLAVGGEVIVAGGRGDAAWVRTDVRHVSTDVTDVLQLRALALAECRGEVVAIGEDHAYPVPGWAEAVVRAHAEHSEVDVVIGCLVNGTDSTSAARANFLTFAAPFVPPMAEVPHRPPPVSVVSIKRTALGGVEQRPGDFETELLPRLHHEGRMVADERIVVEHHQPFGLGRAIENAFDVSRASYGYAHARWSREERRKTARVAMRIAPALWREGRDGQRCAHSPRRDLLLIALIAGASSLGASLGALFGPGGSARRCS